jgi:hypothetical protein
MLLTCCTQGVFIRRQLIEDGLPNKLTHAGNYRDNNRARSKQKSDSPIASIADQAIWNNSMPLKIGRQARRIMTALVNHVSQTSGERVGKRCGVGPVQSLEFKSGSRTLIAVSLMHFPKICVKATILVPSQLFLIGARFALNSKCVGAPYSTANIRRITCYACARFL